MQKSLGMANRLALGRRFRFRKAVNPRCRSRLRAKTVCFGRKAQEGRRRSHERLLRYPNGDTRLIRYPATESEAEPEIDAPKEPNPVERASLTHTTIPLKTHDLPSTPGELVRLIRSADYIKAQREHRRRVYESYRILEENPWSDEQTVYVLSVQGVNPETPQMYTLRTRLHQKDATQRLKTLFRGPSFNGEFIQIDRMTDGVLTFLDFDQAERFCTLLEAETSASVEIADMTSEALFTGIRSAQAVAVWLMGESYFPTVSELTTALKAQPSIEDDHSV